LPPHAWSGITPYSRESLLAANSHVQSRPQQDHDPAAEPLKEKIARAAALRGMTVTSFINAMLEITAERTLRRIETLELTDRDSAALLAMLRKPSPPNAALRKAGRRLRESEVG
jgi:uncharacterized protein (DUF1778 family)